MKPGGLALAGGGWLAADEVVTAVGVRPATGWLDGSGVALDNGVAADEQLRTSVPGVFAVGDCAAFWSPPVRAPAAVRALGRGAARAGGGGGQPARRRPRRTTPCRTSGRSSSGGWSSTSGFHGGGRPDAAARRPGRAARWAACWLAGDVLVALLAVDSPRDLAPGPAPHRGGRARSTPPGWPTRRSRCGTRLAADRGAAPQGAGPAAAAGEVVRPRCGTPLAADRRSAAGAGAGRRRGRWGSGRGAGRGRRLTGPRRRARGPADGGGGGPATVRGRRLAGRSAGGARAGRWHGRWSRHGAERDGPSLPALTSGVVRV